MQIDGGLLSRLEAMFDVLHPIFILSHTYPWLRVTRSPCETVFNIET